MNNEKNEKKITKLGNYKELMEYISYINITVPIITVLQGRVDDNSRGDIEHFKSPVFLMACLFDFL